MPTPHKDLEHLYKGYQGACPKNAKYLFIGLDANFSANIAECPIMFALVKKYLTDGVSFWEKHEKHHPFLLPRYNKGAGWRYHKRFEKLGFKPCDAENVSFLELLHYPTESGEGLNDKHLDESHLDFLDRIIMSDREKYVFIVSMAVDHMKAWSRRTKLFQWLPQRIIPGMEVDLLCEYKNTQIYKIYHFSRSISDEGINKIAKIVGKK